MDLIIIDITKLKNKIKEGDFVSIYDKKFTMITLLIYWNNPTESFTCISKRYLRNYKN